MKKIIFVFLMILFTITLASCKSEYTVKFDSSDGSLVKDQIVKKGSLVIEPVVTKDGFELEYWYLTKNDTVWNFDVHTVEEDMILKASFKKIDENSSPNDFVTLVKEAKMSYSSSTSSFSPVDSTNNASLVGLDSNTFNVLGTVLVRDYNDGKGDTPLPVGLNKDGTIRLYSNQQDGKGNKLSVTLVNSEDSIKKLELIFASNNDKNPTSALLLLGNSEIKLDASNLKTVVLKDNLDIKSFSLQNDFIGSTSNQIWIKEINITYITKELNQNKTSYNVTFNYDSKTKVDKVYENEKAISFIPEKNGYIFTGWYLNNLLYDFNTLVTKDLILEARFKLIETGDNPSDNDPNISSYYNELKGLSGTALNNQIRLMIKSKGINKGDTPQVKKVDMYKGQNYNIYDGFGPYGNREHVWPNSLLGSVKYDLHNLRAAVINTNSTRGNLPFGEGVGPWKKLNNAFYPGDEHKGDVARIVLYQQVRFDLNINKVGNLNMFIKWHLEDPVSDFERSRNNLIQSEVSNRNPFIDYPEYVEMLFGSYNQTTSFSETDRLIGLAQDIINDYLVNVFYVDLNKRESFIF